MAGIKEIAKGRKDLFMISPDDINIIPGWNIRDPQETDEDIIELAQSISENGVMEPLTGYMEGELLYLSNGHRRMCAIGLATKNGAEIKTVPFRTEERYSNDADRTLSIFTRNNSLPLTTLQKATLIKRMMAFGWSEKEIANKTGMSRQYVYKLLAMCAMPEELKDIVESGAVSASVASNEYKTDGAEAVTKITKAVAVAARAGKKKVTAKDIKTKTKTCDKDRKALAIIWRESDKYKPMVVDEIIDLCNRLDELLVYDNIDNEDTND